MDGMYRNNLVFSVLVHMSGSDVRLKSEKQREQCSSPSTETAVQANSEENSIQKLRRSLHTENASFPQLVDIMFADWVMVFAAGFNSFHVKLLEQVVKCSMKTAKGKLARTKLR